MTNIHQNTGDEDTLSVTPYPPLNLVLGADERIKYLHQVLSIYRSLILESHVNLETWSSIAFYVYLLHLINAQMINEGNGCVGVGNSSDKAMEIFPNSKLN